MRAVSAAVMFANAGLFFFGAIQHAGITIGRFHEPYILAAAVVEAICGGALLWGATALVVGSRGQWRSALLGNLVAFGGVLLGKAALAAGRGPRTASNDLYHNLMLVMIGVGIVAIIAGRSAFRRNHGQ